MYLCLLNGRCSPLSSLFKPLLASLYRLFIIKSRVVIKARTLAALIMCMFFASPAFSHEWQEADAALLNEEQLEAMVDECLSLSEEAYLQSSLCDGLADIVLQKGHFEEAPLQRRLVLITRQ